ncbi:MAG: DUF202 domain-containing protein [Nitrospirae bacterium]|nr:DUF202 domain-containing protein [Nitrospirota bacterium]MBF0591912.1 DUF202 domain-containing protein [Nitrospirota bacterium]
MEKVKSNEFNRTSPHLANERTFLAWMRTCMAVMGFGFVLEKFGLFLLKMSELVTILGKSKATISNMQSSSVRLGIIMVEIGVILAVFSTIKYKITEKQLQNHTLFRRHVLDSLLAATVIVIGILIVIHLTYTM